MTHYAVEGKDEDTGEWKRIGLEICAPHRNCGCGNSDSCYTQFYDTTDKQIAEAIARGRKEMGQEVRIVEVD